MRYLYGDSAPFPLQYNFLATLETFIASAARAAQLDAEARKIQDSTAEAAVARAEAIVAVEAFHQAIVRMIQENAGKNAEPQVADYSRQVIDHSARIVEDSKRSVVSTAEREQASARVEIDRRKGEMRQVIETFLTIGRLSILESKVSMLLSSGGRNELSAIFTHPEAIVTSFQLSTAQTPAWQVARKVSEFSSGVDLMIGMKKSLFKRATGPEAVHLDDFILSGFDLSDDAAEIRLRRKPTDQRDAYVFTMKRLDTELVAEVHRPSEVEADMPTPVDFGDRQHLERLWQLIRAGVADVLTHKERLLSVQLDGQDLFEHGRAIPFIERVIKMIAPTVAEISRRSPNPHELSLKMESDQGRREEIYVKKEDLLRKIETLGEKERALFAPFSLTREQWASEVQFD